MENTQNHGRSVGMVTTTFNGEKIQVEVFEDRSVILPDGTVRKVKQEVVDALLAKQQAAAPTPAPAPAPAANPVVIQMNPGTQRSAPIPVAPAGQFYKPAPAAPAQQTPAPVQPASQPNFYQQPQQTTAPTPAPAVNPQPNPAPYQPQQDYAQPLGTALDMNEIDYNDVPPVQPEPEVSQPVAPTKEKKTVFRKGQKPQPAEPAQSMDSFDGATPMPVTKKKKGKAGIIVAAVLAVVVAGSGLMYAFVPSFYDGVNGVLTSVTGKQVGVPPVATSDDGGSTTPQPTTQPPVDKFPLATSNLSDGVLSSLLDVSGFTLTTNGQ